MRTSEVYKILESNPNAKFKITKSVKGDYVSKIIYMDIEGVLRFDDAAQRMVCLGINAEFELIPEPVDFITAIKARKEGKIISCIYDGKERTYSNDCIKGSMQFSEDKILNGQWFIKH